MFLIAIKFPVRRIELAAVYKALRSKSDYNLSKLKKQETGRSYPGLMMSLPFIVPAGTWTSSPRKKRGCWAS
jgi:hypothetical protein